MLHRFTLLPSKMALVEHVLAFCEFDAAPPAIVGDFTALRQDFMAAWQTAGAGDRTAATELLVRGGAPEAAAASLVVAWAAEPRVSVLQTLAQQGDQAVRTREFTPTQSGQYAWWAAPEPGAEAEAPIRVKAAGASDIRNLLIDCL